MQNKNEFSPIDTRYQDLTLMELRSKRRNLMLELMILDRFIEEKEQNQMSIQTGTVSEAMEIPPSIGDKRKMAETTTAEKTQSSQARKKNKTDNNVAGAGAGIALPKTEIPSDQGFSLPSYASVFNQQDSIQSSEVTSDKAFDNETPSVDETKEVKKKSSTKRKRVVIKQQDEEYEEAEEEEFKKIAPIPPSKNTGLTLNEKETISGQWSILKSEIEKLAKTSADKHTLARLQARYNVANKRSLLEAPRLTKDLRCSPSERRKYKGFPNKYVKAPITSAHSSAIGAFRMNVLPGPKGAENDKLALAQYASVASIPFTNSPIAGQYTFTRVPNYQDHDLRKKYLETYYLPVISDGNSKDTRSAAKAIILLFSHFIKETIVTGVSKIALIAMIDYELRKLGMPVMSNPILKAFSIEYHILVSIYGSTPLIQSKFKLNCERKVPKIPIENQETEEKPTVEIMKVKRKYNIKEGQLIDEKDHLIIDRDIDLYDEGTGELIVSFRKKVVSDSTINGINKYAFNTPLELLQNCGAQSKSDKIDTELKNKSKTVPRSAPFGILGLQYQNVCMTSFTSKYKYNVDTITYLGQAIQDLETVYKKVCPQEFNYCEKVMEPLQEYMIFPDSKITCAVEFNYDKQTLTHKDQNKFPGKTFGFLSCFYGSTQKRYTGGYTLFPEYRVGFNVEQGDCMIANFEELIHANSPIIPLDGEEPFSITENKLTRKIPNWHRASLVGYTRGSLVEKTERFSYENSDDEGEQDFSAQEISDEMKEPSPRKQQIENPFAFFMNEAKAQPPKQRAHSDTGKINEANAELLYAWRNSFLEKKG